MFLFINPIFGHISFAIFSTSGEVVAKDISLPSGGEFDTFPEKLLELIKKHTISHILVFTGPGAFTRMRIVTLTLNSLGLTLPGLDIRGGSYFDYLKYIDASLPYILEANTHEYLVYSKMGEVFVRKDSPDAQNFTAEQISIQYEYDHRTLHRYYESLSNSTDLLIPIYIKAPNITLEGKKTLRSSDPTNKS